MKNNILEYKGYHTKVEFDAEEFVLRGKIEGINDLVNFECESIQNVEKEFHKAVDDYLEFCKEVGKEPDKEYKGTFNVRISPDLHRQLANMAMKNGDTLNSSVEKAIQKYVSEEHETERHVRNTIRILAEALKTESKYKYNKNRPRNGEPDIIFLKNIKMKYSEERINE